MAKPAKAFHHWLQQLKERIRSAQIKAAVKVNTELLNLYWELGKEITEKEKTTDWGNKLIPQLSKDLSGEFPEIKGFSRTNLFYIRKWYLFYSMSDLIVPQVAGLLDSFGQQPVAQFIQQAVGSKKKKDSEQQQVALIVPQVVGQIPWGHHRKLSPNAKTSQKPCSIFHTPRSTTGAAMYWCIKWKAVYTKEKARR